MHFATHLASLATSTFDTSKEFSFFWGDGAHIVEQSATRAEGGSSLLAHRKQLKIKHLKNYSSRVFNIIVIILEFLFV